jgi:putative endonuclease
MAHPSSREHLRMTAEFLSAKDVDKRRATAILARLEGRPMAIYIYRLRCADDSYYIGSATGDDLQPRIDQHNSGAFPGYTFHRRPVVLVWSERSDRITDGIAAERQIKRLEQSQKRGADPGRLDND